MLQPCDRGRDEDAEMADVRVGEVDDPLARSLQRFGRFVDRRNPAQCLMRRRDVVAVGGEDDERTADAREIGDAMGVDPNLALLEPVADEQILDDRHHLLAAQAIETIPPALEVQESLLLGVDLREQVGVLVPKRIAGLESFSKPCASQAPSKRS